MKKTILVVLILAVALGGTAALLKHRMSKAPEATASAPAVAVDVTSPTRSTLSRVVEVYGGLGPKTATEVKGEVLGRVAEMRVKEWDRVKAGDLLMQIDPTDFRLIVSRNEAGLKMAKAQLLKAQVDLNRARREWDRALKLKQGGLITGQELDERQTGRESAQAQVALAGAQISQAESQLAESRRSLDKATIRSPIDGTVSQRSVDVGDFVDKGILLFTIVDNRLLDFTASVSSADLPQVAEGQKLTFTVDGMAERAFEGTIKRVNPVVRNSDRSGRIIAEVQNPDGVLRGGLYARGKVLVEERRDVLVLPKASLMAWDLEKRTARVFVVEKDGLARSRPVTTGLGSENGVEITTGVADGDLVVTRGGFNLKEGDKVLVAAREAEKPRMADCPTGPDQAGATAQAAEVAR